MIPIIHFLRELLGRMLNLILWIVGLRVVFSEKHDDVSRCGDRHAPVHTTIPASSAVAATAKPTVPAQHMIPEQPEPYNRKRSTVEHELRKVTAAQNDARFSAMTMSAESTATRKRPGITDLLRGTVDITSESGGEWKT
jgi:hypothetical protein